jgi:hypothetical protein
VNAARRCSSLHTRCDVLLLAGTVAGLTAFTADPPPAASCVPRPQNPMFGSDGAPHRQKNQQEPIRIVWPVYPTGRVNY